MYSKRAKEVNYLGLNPSLTLFLTSLDSLRKIYAFSVTTIVLFPFS